MDCSSKNTKRGQIKEEVSLGRGTGMTSRSVRDYEVIVGIETGTS